jgi:hypothetical protein
MKHNQQSGFVCPVCKNNKTVFVIEDGAVLSITCTGKTPCIVERGTPAFDLLVKVYHAGQEVEAKRMELESNFARDMKSLYFEYQENLERIWYELSKLGLT